MKPMILAALCALTLSGCVNAGASTLEPIPGSITYGGQPRSKLTKSPIGSIFSHEFIDQQGRTVEETYRIGPDRNLLLIERHYRRIPGFGFDDD
jgi:hypothetical protein